MTFACFTKGCQTSVQLWVLRPRREKKLTWVTDGWCMAGGRSSSRCQRMSARCCLLYQMVTVRWPQLRGVRIKHSRSGLLAMTANSLLPVGFGDGIHYCTGSNGSGLAMIT